MHVHSASVLICTYNRGPRLARTLDAFASLAPSPTYTADVIVVDNNSTDDTASVIEDVGRRSRIPIHYAFEPRQGKGFALNAGFALARGDVLALTDDDVRPEPEWLDRIVETFRAHDPVFVGGKVLPVWETPPPALLLSRRAQDIWGPLALVDYGDAPIEYTPARPMQRRPIGANMAFRREAIAAIGGWRTDLGRVDNTLISGEDHEIFYRLLQANLYRGRYEPGIVVHHDVPRTRLTRQYFRRWFFANGQARAVMAADIYPELDFRRVPRVAGVPRFLFRQLAGEGAAWARGFAGSDPLERFIQELKTIRLAGLMWQWRRLPVGPAGRRSFA